MKVEEQWNKLVLREGDQCYGAQESHVAAHSQRWSTSGFTRLGWQGIGQQMSGSVGGENGIQESKRGLEATMLLSALWHRAEREQLASLQWDDGTSLFARHQHDATPMLVRFGIMEGVVAQSARYLVRGLNRHGDECWKTVPYEEFRRLHPRRATSTGVVEIFGQLVDFHWSSPHAMGSIVHHRRLHVPPMTLQRGNANCIVRATEKTCSTLSLTGIEDTCRRVPWFMLEQFPDECSANKRQQAFFKVSLAHVPNFLYVCGPCLEHKFHRIIVQGTHEEDIIGHGHALQVIWDDVARRAKVSEQAKKQLVDKIEIRFAEPDAHCDAVQRRVVQHTLLRASTRTKGVVFYKTLRELSAPVFPAGMFVRCSNRPLMIAKGSIAVC